MLMNDDGVCALRLSSPFLTAPGSGRSVASAVRTRAGGWLLLLVAEASRELVETCGPGGRAIVLLLLGLGHSWGCRTTAVHETDGGATATLGALGSKTVGAAEPGAGGAPSAHALLLAELKRREIVRSREVARAGTVPVSSTSESGRRSIAAREFALPALVAVENIDETMSEGLANGLISLSLLDVFVALIQAAEGVGQDL